MASLKKSGFSKVPSKKEENNPTENLPSLKISERNTEDHWSSPASSSFARHRKSPNRVFFSSFQWGKFNAATAHNLVKNLQRGTRETIGHRRWRHLFVFFPLPRRFRTCVHYGFSLTNGPAENLVQRIWHSSPTTR